MKRGLVVLFLIAFILYFAQADIISFNLTTTDATWTSNNQSWFSFTATSANNTYMNCTLIIDDVFYGTNKTVLNNTATSIQANATLADGQHSWYVNCSDTLTYNSTTDRTINIDTNNPNSTITSPSNNSWTNDPTPVITFIMSDFLDSILNFSIFVDGTLDLNGTSDNDTSTPQNLSALADGVHWVIAQAQDEALNQFNSTALYINIDQTNPSPVITYPPNGTATTNTTPEIILNITDNLDDQINYTVFFNDTVNQTGTLANASTVTLNFSSLSDGLYFINVEAQDEALNRLNSTPVFIYVDTANPFAYEAPTVHETDLFLYVGNVLNISINASDATSGVQNITFNATNACQGSTEVVSSKTNGLYVFNCTVDASLNFIPVNITYKILDRAGNFNFTHYSTITLYNFTTPQNISCSTEFDSATTTDLSQEADLNNVHYRLGIKLNGSNLPGQPWTGISMAAKLNFSSLNFTDSTVQQDLNNLNTVIQVTIPAARTYQATRIYVNKTAFAALDTTTTVELINLPIISFQSTFLQNDTGGTGGISDITYVSNNDGTGNLTFTVLGFSGYNASDSADPEITLNLPLNNTYSTSLSFNASFNGTGTEIDNSSINLTLTGYFLNFTNMSCFQSDFGEFLSCNAAPSLADGVYNLSLFVKDYGGASGNSVMISGDTITVDTQAPSTSINTPANQTWTSDTTPEISFTVTDTLDSLLNYTVYVDEIKDKNGTASESVQTYENLSTLAQGTHTIIVGAYDDAGNSQNSSTWTIYIDTENPSNTFNSPDNQTWTTDTTPEINFTLTDNLDIVINYTVYVDSVIDLNGSLNNATPTNFTLTILSPGAHTIIVEMLDEAGNRVNSSGLVIYVDTTAPSTAFNTTNNSWTSDTTPEISFNITDTVDSSLNYSVYVDGLKDLNGTSASGAMVHRNLSALSEGTHIVYVESFDSAGNILNSSGWVVNIDTTNPTSSISTPGNLSWTNNQTPRVSFTLTDNLDSLLNYTVYVDEIKDLNGTASNNSLANVSLSSLSQGLHTITVEAFDDAGNRFNSSIISIYIDTTGPTSVLNSPGNATWTNDTTPELNFTITDNLDNLFNYSIYVDGSLDKNGTIGNNTPGYENLSTLTQGTHSILIRAVDNATNYRNSSGYVIYVDTTAPNSTILTPANETWTNDTTPEISFNLSDNLDTTLNYTVYVDGVKDLNGSATSGVITNKNLSTLSQGTHTVVVEVFDEVGYYRNSTIVTIYVDTENPSASLTDPTNKTWTSDTTPWLNFTLTDNLDTVINYTVIVDDSADLNGSANNNTPAYRNLSTLAQGNHTIKIEVLDEAGNRVNSSIWEIYVDTTAPNSTILTPSNATWTTNTTPEISFNISDNLDATLNYTVYVDGQVDLNGSTTSGTVTYRSLSTLSEGAHIVIVEAFDEVGYYMNSTALTIYVDTTVPGSVINSTNETTTTDSTPEINFTLTDNLDTVLNYTIYVNGIADITGSADNGTLTFANLSTLSTGAYTIVVEARDEAMNRYNSSGLVITVDSNAPSSTITNPSNNSWTTDTTPAINFTLTDSTDSELNYTVYVDGIKDLNGSASNNTPTVVNLSTLTQGVHTVVVEAMDDSLLRTNSSTLIIYVDTTAPNSTILTPSNKTWTTNTTPEISFNLSDNLDTTLNYTVYVDGQVDLNGSATSSAVTYRTLSTLTQGTHTVVVRTFDEAGYYTNSSALTIYVDTENPSASLTDPANLTWTNDTTPWLNFTLTDNLASTINYSIYVDGFLDLNGSASNNTPTYRNLSTLSYGTRTLVIEVMDEAGNRVNSSTWTIYIDTSAPVSDLLTPSNGTWTTNTTPEISFNFSDMDSTLNYTVYVDGVKDLNGSATSGTVTYRSLSTLSEGAHTVIVEAFDEVGYYTNSSPLTIYVDTTVPGSIINSTNETTTTDSTPEINFTLTDNLDTILNYTIYVDGIADVTGSAYNNSLTFANLSTLSTGTYTIVVEARDEAMNRYNSSGLVITVDSNAPSSTITNPSNNSWITDTTPAINFTLTDSTDSVLNYTVYVDGIKDLNGSAANNTPTVVNLSTLTQGVHTVVVEAMDDSLLRTNSSALVIYVDTTAPNSTILTPSNKTWTTNTTPEISFNLSDNLDTTLNYTVYVDGQVDLNGSATSSAVTYRTLSTLTQGTHTVVVRTFDEAGYYTNSSALTIYVDTENPSAILSYPANLSWMSNTTQWINFTLTDNLDTVINYSIYVNGLLDINGSASNNTPTYRNLSVLAQGNHTIFIVMLDEAGNSVNSSIWRFYIDTEAPTSIITAPLNNTWTVDTTPSITFNLTDVVDSRLNYTVYVDGIADLNGTAYSYWETQTRTLSELAEGMHIVIVEAFDEIGYYTNSSPLTIYVDTTVPSANITSPLNQTWSTDSTPELNFTITDNLAATINYSVYVNGALNTNGTASNNTPTVINLSTLAQGYHVIVVSASDSALNIYNSTGIGIYVDTASPGLTVNYPTNASSIGTTYVNLTFTFTDAVDTILNYTLYVNGALNTTGTASNGTPVNHSLNSLVDGSTYNWSVIASDNASNTLTSGTYNFVLSDSVPPDTAPVMMQGNVSDSDSDGNIEIVWSADPNADYYRIYRSNSNITTASSLTALATLTGTQFEDNTTIHNTTYWYAVTSLDTSLNENKSLVSDSFYAAANDTINPLLPTGLSAETQTDGSVTVTWTAPTQDVRGNADTQSLTYYVFRTTNIATLNTSLATNRLTVTSGTTYTDTEITTGTLYYYVVTSLDDALNHNSTVGANNVSITPSACSSAWSEYSAWTSCVSSQKSRTRTRTCYGGGETTETETATCTVTRSGGGSSSTPSLPSSTHVWEEVAESVMLQLLEDEIAIKQIEIEVKQPVKNMKITVKKVNELPETINKGGNKVYQYIKIDNNINDSTLGLSKINFRVSKQWLSENNISFEDVVLLRFMDKWEELITYLASESPADYSYYAYTPGFSYFAVSAKEKQEVLVNDAEDEIIEDNSVTIESVEKDSAESAETEQLVQESYSWSIPEFLTIEVLISFAAVFAISILVVSVVIIKRNKKPEIHDFETIKQELSRPLEEYKAEVQSPKFQSEIEQIRKVVAEEHLSNDKLKELLKDKGWSQTDIEYILLAIKPPKHSLKTIQNELKKPLAEFKQEFHGKGLQREIEQIKKVAEKEKLSKTKLRELLKDKGWGNADIEYIIATIYYT